MAHRKTKTNRRKTNRRRGTRKTNRRKTNRRKTKRSSRKSNAKSCGRGKIRVRRKPYTRADGTRVAGATYCAEDRGAPGRGPKVIEMEHEGSLGGPGYLKKSAKTRHGLLSKAVKKSGYQSVLGKLNALAVYGKREFTAAQKKKIEQDRDWLVEKYGGPGSFGGRRAANPAVRRKKNALLR